MLDSSCEKPVTARGRSLISRFDLSGRIAIITGGGGLLGARHAEAIAEMKGIPVLLDIDGQRAAESAAKLHRNYGLNALAIQTDVTQPDAISEALERVSRDVGTPHILINNAAHNPKREGGDQDSPPWSRFEQFPLEVWEHDIGVGLTGAFLCSQIVGSEMARRGGGVILNIASDLSVIAPDQRIYEQPDRKPEEQPTKPVSYSVVKHGLIGLTRYLATYWAERNVRINALSPGGIYARQDDAFVRRLSNLIPLGRMAQEDEYKAAVIFMVSDASSYMTGANVIMDGGRTVW